MAPADRHLSWTSGDLRRLFFVARATLPSSQRTHTGSHPQVASLQVQLRGDRCCCQSSRENGGSGACGQQAQFSSFSSSSRQVMSVEPEGARSWTQTRQSAKDLFSVEAAHSPEAKRESVVGTTADRILFILSFVSPVSGYLGCWSSSVVALKMQPRSAASLWMVVFGGVLWISSSSAASASSSLCAVG